MQKVFVPNRGGRDFSAAEKFGELVYATTGTINFFSPVDLYRQFAELTADASSADYMLVAGPQVMVAICAAVLARRFGVLNLLLYKKGEYIVRTIDIDALIPEVILNVPVPEETVPEETVPAD